MRWFYNLNTLWKVLSAFTVVCTIMGIVGWMGLSKMSQVNDMLNTLYESELVGLSHCKEANIQLINIGRATRNVVIEEDKAEMEKFNQAIQDFASEFRTELAAAKETVSTSEGQATIKQIEDGFPAYMSQVSQCVSLSLEGKNAEAIEAMRAGRAAADSLDRQMTELAQLKEKLAEEAYNNSDTVYANAETLLICLVIGGVMLSLGIGFFIARLIANALNRSVVVLQKVAKGDFTVSLNIDTTDEIGQMAEAMNEAVTAIRTALQETRNVADGVASAAQQLSSGSEEISSGAQEQASSLEETAASLEQITSTVQQNADNAQEANQLASGARDVAEKGGRVVSDAVTGMKEINESSKKIADIITTMDEIAFQTNLLALNAAVEAARAGEQGRGFAVVAGEVRKLAQRSAGAAKEIKGLIQDSTRKVEAGTDLVNQSGQTLEEIVNSVKRVTDIVSEIAAASREQTTGIEQVNNAVTQMDSVTQTNASQTEELSSTAESLSSQAEQLQAMVARFKLEDDTAGSRTSFHAPAASARSVVRPASPVRRAAPAAAGGQRVARTKIEDRVEQELDLVGAATSEALGEFEEF